MNALALTTSNGRAPAVPSIHVSNWTFRRNVVAAVLIALPEDQRGPLRWLDEYARKKNLSTDEVGALLKSRTGVYSGNSVYQIYTGRAKPDTFVRAIETFRDSLKKKPKEDPFPFVETTQFRSIASYVEKCQKYGKMGLIFGRNQSGKTESLKHMAAQEEFGQMPIFRVPTNGFLSQLVFRLCKQKGLATADSVGEVKERIFASIDDSMTVVFDEMHQCYARTANTSKPRLDTFEFARETFDVTGATVILTATPVVFHEMTSGPDRLFFEQLMHRSLPPLVLSDLVPTSDLNAFADVLGLDPADGDALTLQDRVIRKEGLGFWIMYLQCARGIAKKLGREPRWTDVAAAEREFRKMSRKAEKEDVS